MTYYSLSWWKLILGASLLDLEVLEILLIQSDNIQCVIKNKPWWGTACVHYVHMVGKPISNCSKCGLSNILDAEMEINKNKIITFIN